MPFKYRFEAVFKILDKLSAYQQSDPRDIAIEALKKLAESENVQGSEYMQLISEIDSIAGPASSSPTIGSCETSQDNRVCLK